MFSGYNTRGTGDKQVVKIMQNDDDDDIHNRMRNAFSEGLKKKGLNPDKIPSMCGAGLSVFNPDSESGMSPSQRTFALKALLMPGDMEALEGMVTLPRGRSPRTVVFNMIGKVAENPDQAWIADESLPAPQVELDGLPGSLVPKDRREALMEILVAKLGERRMLSGVSNDDRPRGA